MCNVKKITVPATLFHISSSLPIPLFTLLGTPFFLLANTYSSLKAPLYTPSSGKCFLRVHSCFS